MVDLILTMQIRLYLIISCLFYQVNFWFVVIYIQQSVLIIHKDFKLSLQNYFYLRFRCSTS